MTTATKTKPTNKVIIKDMEKGDIFSEISHYSFIGASSKGYDFTHQESGQTVHLTEKYVQDLLSTADQFTNTVNVGREDKYWTAKQIADAISKRELPADTKVREGDVRVKGIRTLFEEIYNSEVFGLSFKKQDGKMTVKEHDAAIAKQTADAIAIMDKAKASKKSIATAAAEAIAYVQKNPITTAKAGESRELRGYKVQFTSRDGRYDCVDMDKPANDNVRPVNINTLEWLVYKGTKYIVD